MKRKVSLALAAVLCMAVSVPSFAGVKFSDENDVPWDGAKAYIASVANLGLMVGQPNGDGTNIFRARDNVTYYETIQLAYNLVKNTARSADVYESYVDKWKTTMEKADVPAWAYEAVSFCLESKIILESELSGYKNSDGSNKNATREDVAVIFGRMIIITYTNKSAELNFNDKDKISKDAQKYVSVLYGYNILLGDSDSNFNPQKNINRAEMAVIVTKTNNVLSGKDADAGVDTAVDGEVIGTINNITSKKIVVNTSNGIKAYDYDSSATILFNNKTAGYKEILSAVENGVEIKVSVTLNSSGKIDKISAQGETNTVLGTVVEMTDKGIIIKRNGGDNEKYLWSKECKFYFEGEKKTFGEISDIIDDYKSLDVSAEIDDDNLLTRVEISMQSEGGTVDGAIKNITSEKAVFYLDDGSSKSYKFAEEVYVTVDGDESSVSKAVRLANDSNTGLKGTAYLNKHSQVTKLEVKTIDNLSGIVQSLDEDHITIKTDSGIEKKYAINDNVDVKFGSGATETLDDLMSIYQKGETEVKLSLNRNDEVSKITVYTDFDEYDVFKGTLKNVTEKEFTIKTHDIGYSNSAKITINGEKASAEDLYKRTQNGEIINADVAVTDGKAVIITANVTEASGRVTAMENNSITILGNSYTTTYTLADDSEDSSDLIIRIDNSDEKYTFKELYSKYFLYGDNFDVDLEFNDDYQVDKIYADTVK